jgi:hypothetical protein
MSIWTFPILFGPRWVPLWTGHGFGKRSAIRQGLARPQRLACSCFSIS